jgi:hypothetical protein
MHSRPILNCLSYPDHKACLRSQAFAGAFLLTLDVHCPMSTADTHEFLRLRSHVTSFQRNEAPPLCLPSGSCAYFHIWYL